MLVGCTCCSGRSFTCDLQVGKLSKAERQKRAPDAGDQGSENSEAEDNGEAHSSESDNDALDDDDLTVRLRVA